MVRIILILIIIMALSISSCESVKEKATKKTCIKGHYENKTSLIGPMHTRNVYVCDSARVDTIIVEKIRFK